MKRLRVAVLGHYGNDNLGDEAITQAVIQNLRRRVPGVDIVCFSANPANTAWRHSVEAHPLSRQAQVMASRWTAARAEQGAPARSAPAPGPAQGPATQGGGFRAWLKSVPGFRPLVQVARAVLGFPLVLAAELGFIRASRQRLQGVDLLLIAGSNQFLDNFGGLWGFPYAMLKWGWLGRLVGAKVAFVSIGAGPLTSPVSRFFVRLAMRAAADVSFRDHASQELAVCRWAGRASRVLPDLAFSLIVPPLAPEGAGAGERPTLGLNPMPVHDGRYWHEANGEAYAAYVRQLGRFCEHLRAIGQPWFFYATQARDADVMRDVTALLVRDGWQAPELEARMFVPATVDELVTRLARTEVLVATRFHGVVLSLMVGRPVLGICYHRKTADVMDGFGLGGYHMPLEALDAERLAAMLTDVMAQRATLQDSVRQQAVQYRAALDAQYERLLDLVPDARRRGLSGQPASADTMA